MLTLYNEGSTLGSIKFNCPTLYNDQHWGYLPMLLVHKALLLVSSWSTVRSCLALTHWEDPHPTFGLICWFALTRTHAFVAPKLPLLLWCPQFASRLGQNLQRPSFQILSGKFELQSEQNIEMPTRLPRRIRDIGNLIGHNWILFREGHLLIIKCHHLVCRSSWANLLATSKILSDHEHALVYHERPFQLQRERA